MAAALRLLALALLAIASPGCHGLRFIGEPLDAIAPNGSTVLLPCSSSSSSAVVNWRFLSSPLIDDAPYIDFKNDHYRKKLSNGSLELKSIGNGAPVGFYQCVVFEDNVGSIVSRVASVLTPSLPGFEAEPRDLSVYLGETAFFPCTLRNTVFNRAPVHLRSQFLESKLLSLKVQWLKNEAPFHIDESRMTLMPSGALEIDSITHQDHGTYRCNVSLVGAIGYRLSNKAQLIVNSDLTMSETVTAPRFISEPRSQTVVEGSPVTLNCAALGNPRPSITWLNNGIAIDLNDLDSRFTLIGSGVLYISSVREVDAGTYQCRAENSEDSLDASAVLDVQVPPRFTKKPTDVVATEKEDLILECEIYGKPEPTVHWLKNGEIIVPNNYDMAFFNGYNLRIQGLMSSDAGIFQCVASNIVGNIQIATQLSVVNIDTNDNYYSDAKSFKRNDTSSVLKKKYLNTQSHISVNPKSILSSLISYNSDVGQSNGNSGSEIPFEESNLDIHSQHLNKRNQITSDENINNKSTITKDLTFPVPQIDITNIDPDLTESSQLPQSNLGIEETESTKETSPIDGEDKNKNLPSEPLNLRAVIIKPRFVTLSWNEPEFTNGEIEVYTVLYKLRDSIRERMVNTTRKDVHEINVSQLQPNTPYQFRVIAYNKFGPGLSTQVLDITTQSEEQSLGSPADLNVTVLSPTTIHVTWHAPQQIPGSRMSVDKYQLFWTKVSTGEDKYIMTPNLNYHVENLDPFTEYGIRVVALPLDAENDSSENAGAPTEQIFIKTPGDSPSAPPMNVTLESQTSSTITVHWEAPSLETRNGDITGYKIKYRKMSRKKVDSITTPGDARTVVLKDLDRMVTYQIRICAFNINGSGPFTEWYNMKTLQNDLSENEVPEQPSHINGNAVSDTIYVSWAPPQNQNVKIRGYILNWGIGFPDIYSQTLSEGVRHYTIRNLEQNTEYVISLRAKNIIGEGPPIYTTVRTLNKEDVINGEVIEEIDSNVQRNRMSSVPSSPLPLIPPVGLKADILSGTTAVVYWTDTTLSKSQVVTDQRHYVIRYCIMGSQRYKYFNTSHLNCMIDELRPNTQYEFTVKVVRGNRESPWSMVAVNNTLEAPPGSSPREVTVSVASDSSHQSAILHWLPPNKSNGVITGYLILYTTDWARRDRDWIVQAVIGGGTSALVRSLKPSTTYHFKVQARNAKGYGPFSSIITFTTPAEKHQNHLLIMYLIVGCVVVIVFVGIIVTIVVCCRKSSSGSPSSPDAKNKCTYQKSNTNIKPPDLWIHHDQMELKQMDKSHHGSSGSGDGSSVMLNTTMSRSIPHRDSCEYDSAIPTGSHQQNQSGSLEKRHYAPTYVAMNSINSCGLGPGVNDFMGSNTVRSLYPRTQFNLGSGARSHINIDQNTPLLSAAGSSISGTLPSQSSISSLGQGGATLPLHHHSTIGSMGISPISYSQTVCGVTTTIHGPPISPSPSPASEGFPADAKEREQGHYVAYEALHPPRENIEDITDTGSLGRPHSNSAHPLRSFNVPAPPPNEAPHTPLHHNKVSVTIRPTNTSPYKKALKLNNPPGTGCAVNRLQQGVTVSHSAEEVEALAPSHSTERLHQEMANLEGLMKDLNAITASQFEC